MKRIGSFVILAALFCGAGTASAESAPEPVGGPVEMTITRARESQPQGMSTRVSVNIREMELAQAVRLLAEEAGINVTVGQDVDGTVSCNLTDVSAGTALASFLSANGYEAVPVDGVLVVVREGKSRSKVAIETPRRVRKTFQLPYTGTETQVAVSGSGGAGSSGSSGSDKSEQSVKETISAMLSSSGTLTYYSPQHLMIVEDSENVVAMIEEFVAAIWKTPKQVFIDSTLVEVSLEDGEDLGLRWDTLTKISGHGKTDQLSGEVEGRGTAFVSGGPSLGLDRFFSYGIVNANLEVILEALRTRRRVDLRSNPRVLVMNHRTASIVVGQEIPYLSSIESTAGDPIRTYAFKEVAVRLDVTPHVAEDGMIFLDVHPSVKSVIGYTPDPRQPILSVREAATNVAVRDGDTLIIGGLVQRNITDMRYETPFLAKIPLIGLLFRQKSKSDVKNDLLFLLSPRIVDEAVMANVRDSQSGVMAQLPPHPGEAPKR
jgi:type IV pilus assembly protein PilQ